MFFARRPRHNTTRPGRAAPPTNNSHVSNPPTTHPPAHNIEQERDYWRDAFLANQDAAAKEKSHRQLPPDLYPPQKYSQPPQNPQYQPQQYQHHEAPRGGDARHHGHAEHVGFANQYAGYGQGGHQPDSSAQATAATFSAQLAQLPTVGLLPSPSGYTSTTNSTARDQERVAWQTSGPPPLAYNAEPRTE